MEKTVLGCRLRRWRGHRVNECNADITPTSRRAKLPAAWIPVLRNVLLLILTIAVGICCCCTSGAPPGARAPSLPLAYRIAPPQVCKYPEESKCLVYENLPWNEWNNPRLIVTSAGIKVLLPRSSSSITVPPRSVGDVLEKTEVAEWPMGLIVMVEISGVWGRPEMLERDRSELLNTLSNHAIRMVWGPPSA